MTSPARWTLRSRRVVTPHGVSPQDIVIAGERILALAPYRSSETSRSEDVGDWVVMPGLVDTHVHINEPGRTEWEGFTTATQAALAGGITTLADMPLNCIPVTTSLDAFHHKVEVCRPQLWTDCAFWGGVVPGNTSELEPLMFAGISGFKAFLIYSGIEDFPQVSESDLRQALPLLAEKQCPLLVHAELDLAGEESNTSNTSKEEGQDYKHYLAGRPGRWEVDAIALMIRLSREFRCPIHIVHLSCADALPLIEDAKAEGIPLTVETCAHYLTLVAEEIPRGDTRFKCAPPIREKENAERLWKGLASGVIDFIVSDHSPCTPALKCLDTGDFQTAWGGISSLQFGLSLIWTALQKRGFTLNDLCRWMSEKPAELLKIQGKKACIRPGADADFVLWDPEARFCLQTDHILHRHKVTPYEGKELQGVIHRTLLRGKTVYESGRFNPAGPSGMPLFQHFK
jgi:allantoinase